MRESSIEQRFCKKLGKLGWLTPKMNDNPGYPDRLMLGPNGEHAFIEFKRPGGKARKLQEVVIKDLERKAHLAYIVDSADDETIKHFIALTRVGHAVESARISDTRGELPTGAQVGSIVP